MTFINKPSEFFQISASADLAWKNVHSNGSFSVFGDYRPFAPQILRENHVSDYSDIAANKTHRAHGPFASGISMQFVTVW